MPDDSEPKTLIGFLTAPLKKPAQQERARGILEDELVDRELAALPRCHRLLVVFAWLLAAAAFGLAVKGYIEREAGWSFSMITSMGPETPPLLLKAGEMTEDQQDLFGLHEGGRTEQAKRLHEKHPEDSFYYLHYAFTHFDERRKLPEGYLETIAKLDPRNAMPIYYAAGTFKNGGLEKIWGERDQDEERYRDGVKLRPRTVAAEYEILDRPTYDMAIELIERASTIEDYRHHDHDYEMRAYRASKDLKGRDHLFGALSTLLLMWSGPAEEFQLKHVGQLLEMEAILAVEAENEERFLEVVAMRDRLLDHLAKHRQVTLISALIYKSIGEDTALQFLAASKALGLEAEAERFRREVDGFQEHRDERRVRNMKDVGIPSFVRSGVLTRVMLPVVMGQSIERIPVTDEDFAPLRLAEHAKMRQKCVQAIMLALLVFALASILERFCFPKAIGIPASRCVKLLKIRDWAWILCGGVLLPLIAALLLGQLSFYNGEDYGIMTLGFAFPLLPALCLFIALLIAPLMMIQWRLSLRLPLKHPISPWSKPIIGALIILLLAPPLVYLRASHLIAQNLNEDLGGLPYMELKSLIYILILMGLLLLGMFGWGQWSLFRQPQGRFRMVAVTTALHPCLLIALALLSIALPVQYRAESEWLAKDTLITPDDSKSGLGLYENKVARQVYKEVNAILYPEKE